MKIHCLLLSLPGFWLAAAVPASGSDDWQHGHHGPPVITLYERPNFAGASLVVEVDQAMVDLSLLRFPNGSRVDNKVSSIHVERGAQLRIYAEENFQGEFLELTRSVEDLGKMARAAGQTWNDALSSLRVYERRHGRPYERDPSRTPRVIVFSRKDYRGEAFEIFPGDNLDNLNHENFESGIDLNDEISSVRVVGPVKVRLFFETKNRGEFVDLTADTSDLNNLRRNDARKDWNDKASSLVVEWVGPPRKLDVAPEEEDHDGDHSTGSDRSNQ